MRWFVRPSLLIAPVVGALAVAGVPAVADPPGKPSREEGKNVILIIGDGMGYNSVDVGSLYEHGRSMYQSQEDNPHLASDGGRPRATQVYQRFPTQVGVETGYVFSQPYAAIDAWASPRHATRDNPVERLNVTDSAAAATAMSTGVRTRGGYLGWDRDEQPLHDMVDLASEHGMATGVVTDARFWADTAAGFAVHTEDDDEHGVIEQLLFHEDLDVVMGGGHPAHNNDGTAKESPYHRYVPEDVWAALNGGPAVEGLPEWTLVTDRGDFRALGSQGAARGKRVKEMPTKVIGLPQSDGALFHDRPGDTEIPFAEPMAHNIARLDEMALAALNVLDQQSDQGFFTMIEAATIDGAAHNDQLGRQIEDQVALNDTVEAAVKWVRQNSSWEETTIIVTADHETGNLWGSGTWETNEFQPITGAKGEVPAAEYADYTDVDPDDPEQAPHYHTHQLVPLYAQGPLADDLAAVATGYDEVRGDYLRNIDIATVIRSAIATD